MPAKTKRFLTPAAILAVLAILGVVWVRAPFCARLCFSARLYAESLFANPDTPDYLTEDEGTLVFQSRASLALLAETAWTGRMEDVTGCCLSTWPAPTYYAGNREIGGNGCLIYHHFHKIYLFFPRKNTLEKRISEFLSVS